MTVLPEAATMASMAIDKQPAPRRRRFPARPASRAGQRAAWIALIAVTALIVSAGLTAAFDRGDSSGLPYDLMRLVRAVVIVVFWAAGLGALALSVRSLHQGDRSIFVWAALAVGVAASMLLIGEFTVLE
jgi:hypothetical protein